LDCRVVHLLGQLLSLPVVAYSFGLVAGEDFFGNKALGFDDVHPKADERRRDSEDLGLFEERFNDGFDTHLDFQAGSLVLILLHELFTQHLAQV